MGTGYKGNADHYHSISENLPTLKNEYPYDNGYFGAKGDSSDSKVRHIESPDPQKCAKEFYDKFTYGGIEEPIFNKKTGDEIGQKTTLSDGSIISWRNVSSSADGSPAVDINIEYSSDSGGIKRQKIHFVKEK